jgi:hypothetical protein
MLYGSPNTKRLAKRLKELGVKQSSAFWFEQDKIAGKNLYAREWKLAFNNYSEPYSANHIISAFTIPELGDMLPIEIKNGLLEIRKGTFYEAGVQWQVMYTNAFGDEKSVFENDLTEANARAKMLIYLIKKKLITLP